MFRKTKPAATGILWDDVEANVRWLAITSGVDVSLAIYWHRTPSGVILPATLDVKAWESHEVREGDDPLAVIQVPLWSTEHSTLEARALHGLFLLADRLDHTA